MVKACTAKAASAFLSKSEDATGWRWDVVVASSPEQVVQVQQQAQLAGVKKDVQPPPAATPGAGGHDGRAVYRG